MKFKLLAISLLFFLSCSERERFVSHDLSEEHVRDTLRVAMLYSPASYFQYKNRSGGYDYELCKNLADYLKKPLKIVPVESDPELYELLDGNQVDMVAYSCAETRDLQQKYLQVFTSSDDAMVLVQRQGRQAVTDVTGLDGKRIYIRRGSPFQERMKALNEEIGGKVQIVLAPDTVLSSELIELVADGKIDYTLAYGQLASLYRRYNRQLDVRLQVSFPQRRGWVMRRNTPLLYAAVAEWWENLDRRLVSSLEARYLKQNVYVSSRAERLLAHGAISPYDDYFRRYAPIIGWDWRLLAALAYNESRFNPQTVSYAGAEGLMQLMPTTAAAYGLDSITVFDPEANIAAGVQYIKHLQNIYRKVDDEMEQQKFILASYNAGPAHILDAMALAEKYGKDPHVWYDNVEYYLMKKSDPVYYEDPVVKFGFYRGGQARKYVENVLNTYQRYLTR